MSEYFIAGSYFLFHAPWPFSPENAHQQKSAIYFNALFYECNIDGKKSFDLFHWFEIVFWLYFPEAGEKVSVNVNSSCSFTSYEALTNWCTTKTIDVIEVTDVRCFLHVTTHHIYRRKTFNLSYFCRSDLMLISFQQKASYEGFIWKTELECLRCVLSQKMYIVMEMYKTLIQSRRC